MKIYSIFITSLIISITSVYGQSVKQIVNKISKIDEVQYEHVGIAGILSENYINFENLKKKADIDTLLKLSENENNVISCYAIWGLIDKKYSDILSILAKYINSDKKVKTFNGCIKSEDNLSNEVYNRFWNKTTNKVENKTLMSLDSLIIYNNKPYSFLLSRALKNRVYPKIYNQRIAVLAFDKENKDAIFYLSNWYKAEYINQIREALIKYLNNTDFKNIGINTYYETINELLKFNDDKLVTIILEKLNKDKSWKPAEEKFKFLLYHYSIYEI